MQYPIFMNWLENCFVREVGWRLKSENIAFLSIDYMYNAPGNANSTLYIIIHLLKQFFTSNFDSSNLWTKVL